MLVHHAADAVGPPGRAARSARPSTGVIGSFGLERFRLHPTGPSVDRDPPGGGPGLHRAGRPRLLLLDEPTAGIAQREAEAFIPLLQRLHEVTDSTILLVEHDVPLVFELCSTVVVMQTGSVVVAGSPDEVRRTRGPWPPISGPVTRRSTSRGRSARPNRDRARARNPPERRDGALRA